MSDYFDSGYGDTIALFCGTCEEPITDVDRGDRLADVLIAQQSHECSKDQG